MKLLETMWEDETLRATYRKGLREEMTSISLYWYPQTAIDHPLVGTRSEPIVTNQVAVSYCLCKLSTPVAKYPMFSRRFLTRNVQNETTDFDDLSYTTYNTPTLYHVIKHMRPSQSSHVSRIVLTFLGKSVTATTANRLESTRTILCAWRCFTGNVFFSMSKTTSVPGSWFVTKASSVEFGRSDMLKLFAKSASEKLLN